VVATEHSQHHRSPQELVTMAEGTPQVALSLSCDPANEHHHQQWESDHVAPAAVCHQADGGQYVQWVVKDLLQARQVVAETPTGLSRERPQQESGQTAGESEKVSHEARIL
jgi:hypothetical protein